ncbi:MAG: hypothetical protein ACJA0U_000816 [Salibacteraceae bacterium]|jgi:hypothetical protein
MLINILTFNQVKKFNSIAAITLLSIYGVVVLHNMTPHFECESDSNFASTEASHYAHTGIHHSHQEDRHDHGHEEVNSSWLAGLLGLMGDIEHHELGEGHFENFTAQTENFSLNISIQNNVDLPSSALFKEFLAIVPLEIEVNFEDPPVFYERHSCGSPPLRGPPSKA